MTTAKKSKAAICRKYKITAATLAAWQAEGIDIHDDQAMTERAARKHKATGQDLFEARLKKLQGEARCATLKAAQLEGTLIDLAEVKAAMTRIGAITKSLLLRMQADLPPMMEGQSPSGMAKIIGESAEKILAELSLTESELWQSD